MRLNAGDDVPFDFPPREIDPTGRVVRTVDTVTPKPSRPRRRRTAGTLDDPADAGLPLVELLRLSIRAVTEREIQMAETEYDLCDLLRMSLEDIRRRKECE